MAKYVLPSLAVYDLGKALEHLAGEEVAVLAVIRAAAGYEIDTASPASAELVAHLGLEAQ